MQMLRYIDLKGVRYLRLEDVVELIREAASTQETDSRRYLEELARNIEIVYK